MLRCSVCLMFCAAAAVTAFADIAPPPPADGKKRVKVTHEVILGPGVSGHVFFTLATWRGSDEREFARIELNDRKAVALPEGHRNKFVSLHAVPEATWKTFAGEKALMAALEADKVPGARNVSFESSAVVDGGFPHESVTLTHTITEIGPEGIKANTVGLETVEVAANERIVKYAIAGAALAVVVVLAGLRIMGRRKAAPPSAQG